MTGGRAPQTRQVGISRSLILQQPWASAVAAGAMPVLIKSFPTKIRGWVGVLSTGTLDPHADVDRPSDFPLRSIVGAVELRDSTPIEGNPLAYLRREFGDEFMTFYPKHYAITGQHVWRLSNAMSIARPRPFDGVLPRIWATTHARLQGEVVKLENGARSPERTTPGS